jgi:hypothetical protein
MTLYELQDVYHATIMLRKYSQQNSRWTAYFEDSEWKEYEDATGLHGGTGEGKTPDEAMSNYVSIIRGKHIVFHASSKDMRREFGVPENLEHKAVTA